MCVVLSLSVATTILTHKYKICGKTPRLMLRSAELSRIKHASSTQISVVMAA